MILSFKKTSSLFILNFFILNLFFKRQVHFFFHIELCNNADFELWDGSSKYDDS